MTLLLYRRSQDRTRSSRSRRWVRSCGVRFLELVEQRLCFHQIRRVESLGEPPVDLRQRRAGLWRSPARPKQSCKARHAAKLERLRLLAGRDVDRLAKTRLGLILTRN